MFGEDAFDDACGSDPRTIFAAQIAEQDALFGDANVAMLAGDVGIVQDDVATWARANDDGGEVDIVRSHGLSLICRDIDTNAWDDEGSANGLGNRELRDVRVENLVMAVPSLHGLVPFLFQRERRGPAQICLQRDLVDVTGDDPRSKRRLANSPVSNW